MWKHRIVLSLLVTLGSGLPLTSALADPDIFVQKLEGETTEQLILRGNECISITNQPSHQVISDTECYVTQFPEGNYKTYLQTNPDGSYSASFGFSFDLD